MLLAKGTVGRFGCHDIGPLEFFRRSLVKKEVNAYLGQHPNSLAKCEIRENVKGKEVEPQQRVDLIARFTYRV